MGDSIEEIEYITKMVCQAESFPSDIFHAALYMSFLPSGIRGDSSRTTEGSGLGLSIAKSLTVLMGGVFDIKVDGDLFKASITFPQYADGNGSDAGTEDPVSEDDYEIEELEPEERTEEE